jgi:hypothetical protein
MEVYRRRLSKRRRTTAYPTCSSYILALLPIEQSSWFSFRASGIPGSPIGHMIGDVVVRQRFRASLAANLIAQHRPPAAFPTNDELGFDIEHVEWCSVQVWLGHNGAFRFAPPPPQLERLAETGTWMTQSGPHEAPTYKTPMLTLIPEPNPSWLMRHAWLNHAHGVRIRACSFPPVVVEW